MWICDPRASVRMTPSNHAMFDFAPCNDRGKSAANKELMLADGYGSMWLQVVSGEKFVRLKLSGVAVVPRLSYNLVSFRTANRNGFDFIERASGLITLLYGILRFPIQVTRTASTPIVVCWTNRDYMLVLLPLHRATSLLTSRYK